MKSLMVLSALVITASVSFGQCAVATSGYQVSASGSCAVAVQHPVAVQTQFVQVPVAVAQPVYQVRQVRVVQAAQPVFVQQHAVAVQQHQVFAQQGYGNVQARGQGFGGGRVRGGGGLGSNALNGLLSPQSILGIAGAVGGASIGGPVGAGLGSALGNFIGAGLR